MITRATSDEGWQTMQIIWLTIGVIAGALAMAAHQYSAELAVKAERKRHAADIELVREAVQADRRAIKEAAYSAGYAAGRCDAHRDM